MQSMNRHGTPPFIHSSPETIIIVTSSNRSPNKLISDASPIISQGSYSCTGRGIIFRTIVQRSYLVSAYYSPAAFLPPPLTPAPPKLPLRRYNFTDEYNPIHLSRRPIPSLDVVSTVFSRCDDTIPSAPSRCYGNNFSDRYNPIDFFRRPIQSLDVVSLPLDMEDDPSTSVSIHPTAVPDNRWIQMRRCNASHVHGEVSLFSLPCFLFTITMIYNDLDRTN